MDTQLWVIRISGRVTTLLIITYERTLRGHREGLKALTRGWNENGMELLWQVPTLVFLAFCQGAFKISSEGILSYPMGLAYKGSILWSLLLGFLCFRRFNPTPPLHDPRERRCGGEGRCPDRPESFFFSVHILKVTLPKMCGMILAILS